MVLQMDRGCQASKAPPNGWDERKESAGGGPRACTHHALQTHAVLAALVSVETARVEGTPGSTPTLVTRSRCRVVHSDHCRRVSIPQMADREIMDPPQTPRGHPRSTSLPRAAPWPSRGVDCRAASRGTGDGRCDHCRLGAPQHTAAPSRPRAPRQRATAPSHEREGREKEPDLQTTMPITNLTGKLVKRKPPKAGAETATLFEGQERSTEPVHEEMGAQIIF